MTEELRGASGMGREMVETEEAVELAKDIEKAVEINEKVAKDAEMAMEMSEKMAGKQPVRPPQQLAVADALADMNVSPGPITTERFRQLAREARGTVTTGEPSAKTKLCGQQPSSGTFLSRDYHSVCANRFLFSCADEYDGYNQNKGSGWQYELPK